MRNFLSSAPSLATASRCEPAGSAAPGVRSGRAFWRKQSGALGGFGGHGQGRSSVADAEAAQRALIYRSEAFAEDLGPAYAAMRYTAATGSVALDAFRAAVGR